MLSLKPSNLKRYKDIGWLFVKYGLSDLLNASNLSASMLDDDSDVRHVPGDPTPEEFAADLEQLGATFVKLGQLLASRGDLLPQPYTEALARLQDDVSPVAFEHIEHAVFEELGKRVDLVFREFDRVPIAAASLGQVHRAKLHNGTVVAVKIQRPGVRTQVAGDIEAMMQIATEMEAHSATARKYEFCRIVETLGRQLKQELNYSNEIRNTERLRSSLEEFDNISIPKVYEGLSTDRILTMDYVTGEKVTELSTDRLRKLRRGQVAADLFRCYLHQLLVDGCFHADPHPGNMVVTDDGNICLMDFGLTVTVDENVRTQLIKILLHLSDGNGEQLAREVLDISGEIGNANPREFTDGIVHLVGRHHAESLDSLQVGRIIMDIQQMAVQNGVRIREEIKLLGKTLMQLDEVVLLLDPKFNPNQMLKQHLGDIIRQTNEQPSSMAHLYQMLTETTELTKALPQRLNNFTKMLAQNEVRVKVDTIDEAAFLRSMHKIANRIAAGLILAALIVGASLMLRLDTPLTIFGYPAIAMFFFMTAAICGLKLVYQATFTDNRDTDT